MRGISLLAAAVALAACEPPPPHVTVDGVDFACDAAQMRADRSALEALQITGDLQINTADPAEAAGLQRMQAESRERLALIERRLATCDAAISASPN